MNRWWASAYVIVVYAVDCCRTVRRKKERKTFNWMGYNVPFITLILILVVFFLVPCTGRATKKTQIFFRTLFPSFIFFYVPCLMVDEKEGPTSCEALKTKRRLPMSEKRFSLSFWLFWAEKHHERNKGVEFRRAQQQQYTEEEELCVCLVVLLLC